MAAPLRERELEKTQTALRGRDYLDSSILLNEFQGEPANVGEEVLLVL